MFKHEVRVRFNECDGLSHVNNGVYFQYFEDARYDVFKLFNPTLELSDWNLIVASARCDFLKQVTYGQTLVIYSWLSKIGKSSFTVEHAAVDNGGDFVARGQAVLICFDYEKNCSAPISNQIRGVLAEHQEGPNGAPVFYS